MPSGRVIVRRVVFWSLLALIAVYLDLSIGASHGLARDIERIQQRGEPVHLAHGFPTPTNRRAATQPRSSMRRRSRSHKKSGRRGESTALAHRLDLDKPGGTELSLPDIVAAYRRMRRLCSARPRDATRLCRIRLPEDRLPSAYELPLVTLGSFACLRADISPVHGDGDAAATALVPAIRLERTFRSSGHGAQQANRVLGSLRILFRHVAPSDASLVTLQRAFESLRDDDDMLQNLLQQRAQFIDMLEAPIPVTQRRGS